MAHSFFIVVPDYDQILSYRYNPGDTFQPIISELAEKGYPTKLIYYNGIQSFPLEPDREIIDCFPLRQSQVLIFATDEDYQLPIIESLLPPNDILVLIVKRDLKGIFPYSVSSLSGINQITFDLITNKDIHYEHIIKKQGLAELDLSAGKYTAKIGSILPKHRDQILFVLKFQEHINLDTLPTNMIDMRPIDILAEASINNDIDLINIIFNLNFRDLTSDENEGELLHIIREAVKIDKLDVADAILDSIGIRNRRILSITIRKAAKHAVRYADLKFLRYLLSRGEISHRFLKEMIEKAKNLRKREETKNKIINFLEEYGYENGLLRRHGTSRAFKSRSRIPIPVREPDEEPSELTIDWPLIINTARTKGSTPQIKPIIRRSITTNDRTGTKGFVPMRQSVRSRRQSGIRIGQPEHTAITFQSSTPFIRETLAE